MEFQNDQFARQCAQIDAALDRAKQITSELLTQASDFNGELEAHTAMIKKRLDSLDADKSP